MHKHNLHVVTHISSKCFLEVGVLFFRCFFFLLLEDEDPQNVPSARRGEEKWLHSHGKTQVKFIQIH